MCFYCDDEIDEKKKRFTERKEKKNSSHGIKSHGIFFLDENRTKQRGANRSSQAPPQSHLFNV